MKIDMSAGEIWDLLKQGSTNQRNFIGCLRYSEFNEFIEIIGDYPDFDLRDLINGGVLKVVETPEDAEEIEDYVIYENERIGIVLIWLYLLYL